MRYLLALIQPGQLLFDAGDLALDGGNLGADHLDFIYLGENYLDFIHLVENEIDLIDLGAHDLDFINFRLQDRNVELELGDLLYWPKQRLGQVALLYFPLQFVENVLHIPAGFSLNALHTLEGTLVILAVDEAHPVVKRGTLANGVREEIGRRGPHQGGLGLLVTLSSPYLGVSMPPVPRRIPLHQDRVKRAIGDHVDRGVGKLHLARREKVRVLAGDVHATRTWAQRGQPKGRQLPECHCLIEAIAALPGE